MLLSVERNDVEIVLEVEANVVLVAVVGDLGSKFDIHQCDK